VEEKMDKKELKFEDAMTSLEKITKELESDDLSLDESLNKFEEGMKLSKTCSEILDSAEKKITILLDGEEKNFVQED
jgi:exodeoxyribonuclease VII small subunit